MILSPDIKTDEEKDPSYVYKRFYPAHPGDLLDSKYKLISKLG
jgi:hypothetical protein